MRRRAPSTSVNAGAWRSLIGAEATPVRSCARVLRTRLPAAHSRDRGRRGLASGTRPALGRRHARSRPSPRRRTTPRPSGSSSCPTSAASTASTRSSRCASPSAATPPSRSTTSGARPASPSATTTSTTRSTSPRRTRPPCRPTSAPRSRGCARPRAARASTSSPSASASAGATRGSPRQAVTASRARSASTARPASATASPGRCSWRSRWKHPCSRCRRAPTSNITAEDNAALDRALDGGRRRARGRHLRGRPAQLLRPPAGRAPGGIRRRLGARHRVRRHALLTDSPGIRTSADRRPRRHGGGGPESARSSRRTRSATAMPSFSRTRPSRMCSGATASSFDAVASRCASSSARLARGVNGI